MEDISLSIVIPIFNEAETLSELWRQLHEVIKQLDVEVEVIFVDDGSKDASLEIMLQLCVNFKQIKVIKLSRNFGHQNALTAGIDSASGSGVVLMDGDLQDSPCAILDFVYAWKEGYEVVYAIRAKRKESALKRLAFTLFYRLLNRLAGIDMPLDAGIFSLMDRKVVDTLKAMPEHNRYLSGLRAYTGFNQKGIIIERGPRYSGKPKVTLFKLVKLALDGIFSFSTIPLRIATWLGVLFAVSSFIIGIFGLYFKYILERELFNWPHGLTTTFFMGGTQLIFLGILGEYVSRIYEEVKRRPYYVVDRTIGF